MTGRSVALTAGRSRKPSRPSRCHRSDQVHQFGGGAVEDQLRRNAESTTPENVTNTSAYTLRSAPPACRDLAEDGAQRVVVTGRDEDEIGAARGEFVDRRAMRQRGDDGLALGWPRGDRRPLDREVLSGEVDVVQLVAVDESTGRDVADHRVVLPAVPQPADHLDGVGGLVEQVAPCRRPGGRTAAASCAVPLTRTCQPARPWETKSSVAMALETWNGSVWVTVATGISPMCGSPARPATRPARRRACLPASAARSPARRRRCGVSASSKVTKSSSPRSAVTARPDQ